MLDEGSTNVKQGNAIRIRNPLVRRLGAVGDKKLIHFIAIDDVFTLLEHS